MQMGFVTAVEAGIKSKSLTMARIDESVKRTLQLKETLNMMDEKITMNEKNIDKVGSDADRQEALEMARQSIILAENKDNVLPLKPDNQAQNSYYRSNCKLPALPKRWMDFAVARAV